MLHELLNLDGLPRQITFPFPLKLFSYSQGLAAGTLVRRCEADLEFCLRLRSTEPEAVDRVEGNVYRSSFPFLFLKLPHRMHETQINGTREALSLYYDGDLAPHFQAAGFDLTGPVIRFELNETIAGLLHRMRELGNTIALPGIPEQFDLLAFQLLETVFLQSAQQAPGADDEEDKKVRRIASCFQLHFSEHLDLETLLKKHGLSRRSFFRRWKKLYGLPPTQYLRELRFSEAMRQVNGGGLPVDEIIRQCGFPDRTLFYRLFRDRTGMTPAQYRARPRSNSDGKYPA